MSSVFKYVAYDSEGEKRKGEVVAVNESEAESMLIGEGLSPLSITEATRGGIFDNTITLADIEQSTSQMAILLNNGLKVDRALSVLVQSCGKSAIAGLWSSVLDDVKKGTDLSAAIKERESVFTSLYAEMVKIGESTGNLSNIFSRLADNLAFQIALKKKVIQAATYPFFILIVCVVAILAIFNFVVPSMSSVFSSMETIPSYTQVLLDTSSWMRNNQQYLFAALVTLIVLFVFSIRNPEYKKALQQRFIKLPGVKRVVVKVDRIRYATALQLTLESGVNLSGALDLSSRTVLNEMLQKRLIHVGKQIASGNSLADSLRTLDFFDELSLSLIAVGEESGSLDNSFSEIASRARNDFESWLMKFTALLEPLLILIMGGLVGSVVVTMLLSIVSINDVSF
ncbi:type II secretion system F family protein [Pseudoalteromonas sp. CO325X]|uniref:type II secretion system F family protein n=1 Tax=Pseudoalteromonas sp. CO325X TaxID=1777262 RepID=UPI001022FB74|nr:type II secretion system F family protein [Pseudoalteromonas sp. CO325X]RZF79166.1 type II secretion system F family protein [Pseudoalteromonas sp. CO325X]